MKKLTNKDKTLLTVSAFILTAITAFVVIYWEAVYSILERMLNGVDLVEDYIQSLGIAGIIIMMLIVIVFFFFPVISTMPVQIACGIAYGILGGSCIILLALIIATQLLYLFRQNFRAFSSPKQVEKRLRLEKMIKESNRNIYITIAIAYLLPAVPFLVISNLAASGLKYGKYTLVTVLGMIPDILTTIFLGEKLLSSSPIASIITLILIVIIIALSVIFNGKLVTWIFTSKKNIPNESKNS